MTKWQEVRLGDVCEKVYSGGTPKSSNSMYYNGNIPWLNTKEVHFNRIYKTEKYITSAGLENSSAKWVPSNSVIVAMYGATAGNVAISFVPLTTNQACCNLIIDENKSTFKFIYYYLLFKNTELASLANGGAQQNLNKQQIKDFPINLPPLEIQKKIAGVLGALDDKIELNNKINNNLEQQAQALFKSWFVDFEPFGGTMPKDWKVGNLLDIADYLNGLAMQKFRPAENDKGLPVLKIKELRQGFCDSNSELCSLNVKNEYIVNDGDVIFSWSGSLLVDFWCGGKCGLNQHLFKVTSKNFDKWFYFLWTKHYLEHFAFIAADKATTMGHIKREELEKAKVVIPSSDCYQKMNQIMTPIYDLLISNRIENNRLIQLRDTLLPKLMSGEIDVSKVDILNSNLLFRENA